MYAAVVMPWSFINIYNLSVSAQSFLTVKVSVWTSAEETRTARQERSASAMAVATCAHQSRKQVRLSALPKLLGLKGQCTWSCPTFQQMFDSNLSWAWFWMFSNKTFKGWGVLWTPSSRYCAFSPSQFFPAQSLYHSPNIYLWLESKTLQPKL